jgi:hypothetical protein
MGMIGSKLKQVSFSLWLQDSGLSYDERAVRLGQTFKLGAYKDFLQKLEFEKKIGATSGA